MPVVRVYGGVSPLPRSCRQEKRRRLWSDDARLFACLGYYNTTYMELQVTKSLDIDKIPVERRCKTVVTCLFAALARWKSRDGKYFTKREKKKKEKSAQRLISERSERGSRFHASVKPGNLFLLAGAGQRQDNRKEKGACESALLIRKRKPRFSIFPPFSDLL